MSRPTGDWIKMDNSTKMSRPHHGKVKTKHSDAKPNTNVDISFSSGIVNVNIGISFRRLLFFIIGFNALLCIGFMVFTNLNYHKMKPNWLQNQNEDLKLLRAAVTKAKSRAKRSDNNTQNGFVIMTTTNKAFIDITDNWLESMSRLKLDYNVTLIAEDRKSYLYYKKHNQNGRVYTANAKDYDMKGTLKQDIDTYQQLIRRRTIYVRDTLYSGVDVLLVDVDTVWLKDPLEIMWDTYNLYDLWIAQGHDVGVPCPCFMYMKAVPSVMNLVHRWVNRLTYKPKNRPMETDQNALQYVLGDARRPGSNKYHVEVMTLSKANFPTGIEFFDKYWLEANANDVVVAHANHQGREDAKIDKLKEFKLWFLPGRPVVPPENEVRARIAAKVKQLQEQDEEQEKTITN